MASLLIFFALAPDSARADEKLKPADVLVGLGFGPATDKQGKPNPELERRVVKTVELYKQGLAPYIIFTGTNTGAGVEAEVMKAEAVKMGVPADKIFAETRAIDTITNAKYSVEIMKQHGWKSAILVSNAYHIHRGKWLFEANPGIEHPDRSLSNAGRPALPYRHHHARNHCMDGIFRGRLAQKSRSRTVKFENLISISRV